MSIAAATRHGVPGLVGQASLPPVGQANPPPVGQANPLFFWIASALRASQ